MNLFMAHNGVDHQTASEAVLHDASTSVLKAILAIAIIVGCVAIVAFVNKKLSAEKYTSNKDSNNKDGEQS